MSAALRLVLSDGRRAEDTADMPEQLRQIAHDVESGLLAGARNCVVIVDRPGTELMVYGISEGDQTLRLNAAYMLLALGLRELEKVASQIRE